MRTGEAVSKMIDVLHFLSLLLPPVSSFLSIRGRCLISSLAAWRVVHHFDRKLTPGEPMLPNH
jgi:hypothetical protein